MDTQILLFVVGEIKKYFEVCNKPNDSIGIDIKIENNNLIVLYYNQIRYSRSLDFNSLKNEIKLLDYSFDSSGYKDAEMNPLEADRKSNQYIWNGVYKGINFPKVMPIVLMFYAIIGRLPTLFEFSSVYLESYLDLKENNDVFRKNIGYKIEYPNNHKFLNLPCKFNRLVEIECLNVPRNDFVVYDIANRLYKVYGSCIRDIYHCALFTQIGLTTQYSWNSDLEGVDLFLNGYPIYAFTSTIMGKDFRNQKIQTRHPYTDFSKGIELRQSIKLNSDLLFTMTVEKAIELKNLIETQKIERVIKFLC